ncbi:MAG: DUF3576 domain-containing protein, partial [Pseudotabrizicola sp.]|nr:DUF3576 domain-containing protein [Pseudotabrizicola sp.]
MFFHRLARVVILTGLVGGLSACGGGFASGDSGLFRRNAPGIPSDRQLDQKSRADAQRAALARASGGEERGSTIWDLFGNRDDPNTTVEVNKYLWQASLE